MKRHSRKFIAFGLGLSASLIFAAAANADEFSLVLNPNYPSAYTFYSFTASDGSTQNNIPVSPYQISLSDTAGEFNDTAALAICLDYDNDSYVGQAYSGELELETGLASMETSYLANELNLDGGTSASTDERGAISFAIWQIDFPSSTQADGSYLPEDPASQSLVLQAYAAVTSGEWTAADNSLYPTFIPNNTTSQRYSLILPGTTPVQITTADVEPTPEPGTIVMMGAGLAMLAVGMRRKVRG